MRPLVLSLMLALSLAACQNSENQPDGSLLDSLTRTPDGTLVESDENLETTPLNEYKYNPTTLPPALNP